MNSTQAPQNSLNSSAEKPTFLGTESRALELLASGYEATQVARALGLSDGRISQLIHTEEFATELASRRFANLKKHNDTDDAYDRIEKKLIEQLERVMPLAMDPMKVTRMLQVINAAKRRGISAPDHLQASQRRTVTLNIPIAIVQKFQSNAAGQVVSVTSEDGSAPESLVTIQSGNVQRLLNEHAKEIAASSSLPVEPIGVEKNSREYRAYRREVRAIEGSESNGGVWKKAQGRESVDLLAECGFTHEVEVGAVLQQASQQ